MKNKKILTLNFKYAGFIIFSIGVISSFGFAPFHFFPLTIFSYVFLIYFLKKIKREKKNIFLYSLLYSLGIHLGLLYWIAISFQTANSGGYYAGSLAVFILSVFLSIFLALPFYFLFKYNRSFKNISFGFLFIFIFTTFDWLKGNILWGFPWTSISSLWSFSSITLFPFSVFGVWGYSLITYSLIVSFYYFFFNLKKGIFFSLPFIFATFVLPYILKVSENKIDTISIRIVQPNIKQEDKWDKKKFINNYKKLSSLITLPGYKEIDLIILPETAIDFGIDELNKNKNKNSFDLAQIKNIIIGALRIKKNDNEVNIFNSMFLIQKNNTNILYHDKLKLVPFGEFIPFSKIFKLNKLTSGQIDFSPGENPRVFELSAKINILPLICYEVIFPKLTSELNNNYNLIVNITNDDWYKNSSGPYQHFSHSKIRAVMEGRTLIRSANTGISGIINPKGIVISKLGIQKEGVIDYRLNIKNIETVYSVYREKVFYLIMLTLFMLICISFFYNKFKQVKSKSY
ncbi:MAG: apolipoprotein N-acyltransferase [Alphaproteobacteria bacterium TMED93]|nr:MAG: apolipoprotein N-acyltransferase [Alphaproteobacteria bacterium TMED93]